MSNYPPGFDDTPGDIRKREEEREARKRRRAERMISEAEIYGAPLREDEYE